MKCRAKHGFTMMEIMIVMGLIGGLMILLLPPLFRYRKNAAERKTRAAMTMLKSDLLRYKVDMGQYPKSSDGGLNALMRPPSPRGNWTGPYIDEVPKDDGGNEIAYYNPPRSKASGAFELVSQGEGGDEPVEIIVTEK